MSLFHISGNKKYYNSEKEQGHYQSLSKSGPGKMPKAVAPLPNHHTSHAVPLLSCNCFAQGNWSIRLQNKDASSISTSKTQPWMNTLQNL